MFFRRTKICIALSLVFFAAFWLSMTPKGQEIVTGPTDHLELHERIDALEGAAIAPYVYLLLPGLVWALLIPIFFFLDGRKALKAARKKSSELMQSND